MSDLGEMRLGDVYRGLGNSSMTINEETILDDRDKTSMGLAEETYKEEKNGNTVTKVVTDTDKNKIMFGIAGFIGVIIIIGMLN